MKRLLKIIGYFFLAFILLIIFIFIKGALTPMTPKDYTETVPTGGRTEEKYLKTGVHEVACFKESTDDFLKDYRIYYPTDLTDNDKKYPAVIFVNGSGVPASKYQALFEHLASWGFIVVGNEDENSWAGMSSEKSLDFLLRLADSDNSIFYNKVDVDNIGISGHSQGGVGVFNAITDRPNSSVYKAAVSLSPANEELASNLKWPYDLTKISIPILMIAGTEGEFETEVVIPGEKLIAMFDKISSDKIMMRKKGCEHGEMLYSADGYVTAWFMWQLKGDMEAKAAFVGIAPEILNNNLYQDVRISISD